MNDAANLLNLLVALTIAADWQAPAGTRAYHPDGRVLTKF